ncbi:hypothetical protein MMG00_02510 [Ignatzschineria rhizosphaerae]|uniref:Ribbon-helix-helix protein CopG domain-containing protein n=1 Tax=Ignatzschineria rhizosphaerae TaxID=2923279 RepID=A0ABY3X1J3_9GAMM|nr:hypothetical protein [Ignatzschineria rhizosphaerae]UNM96747.1 hypothetical protein MMG00_02510 [Ignatzschineria rhizosphaerae]
MGKNGTYKKLVPFSVLIEKDLLDLLKQVAKDEDRSLSAQARRYIEQGIKDDSNGQS